MSGRIFLDEIYSKDGQNKVLDTKSFDANNNFTTSNTGFRLNYQTANAALIINQTGAGDALSVNKNIKFSSGGIDFGTTTSGSGTVTGGVLDDYEEGTYSPTLTGSNSNTGAWVTNIQGNYIKIGNLVWVKISIVNPGTNYNNLSGSWRFSLPFTQASLDYMGGYVSYSRHIPTISNGSTLALSLYNSLAWLKWLKSNTDEAGDVSGTLHQYTLFGGTILYKTS